MHISLTKDKVGIIHEYLTYLFFFLIPMPDSILPLALGAWVASWLIWRILHYKEKYPLPNKSLKIAALLFLAFNAFNYLSAFWGFDPPSGASIMEHRLSFLIISVILLFGFYPTLNLNKIIKAFFWGNLAAIALFAINFLISYFTDEVLKYQLDVVGLSELVDAFKHPAYMSLNLILSYFLYLTILGRSKHDKVLSVLSFVLLALFIFFSRSRAGVLNLILLSFGVMFYLSRQYVGLKKTFLIAIPLVIVFSYGIVNTKKFANILDNSEHVAVRAPRKILWKSALQMTAEKPLLGYGIGSSKQLFIEKCELNGIYYAENAQYNVHNQFLEFALESGLVGLSLVFFSLFYFLKGIPRNNRWKAISLLFIFGVALFFESMLLRVAGISSFLAMLIVFVVLPIQRVKKNPENTLLTLGVLSVSLVLFVGGLLLNWKSHKLSFLPEKPSTYAYKGYSLVNEDDLLTPFPSELSNMGISVAKYDATATTSTWSGNAYLLNKVAEEKLNAGETLTFSSYCYVSSDFDGDWVKISIDNTPGKASLESDFYDLRNKSTWQKLEVVVDGETGFMPAHFFFERSDCSTFDDLKGYVLFAYPQYIITKK